MEYAPSTRFYLEDDVRPATRWAGRLPFPMQVVARVEVIDELSGGKLTTEYRYHQGYWDGDEREFRGFGMVEAARYRDLRPLQRPGPARPAELQRRSTRPLFSPPTLTRTWFHQGADQDSRRHRGASREADSTIVDGRPVRCSAPESAQSELSGSRGRRR